MSSNPFSADPEIALRIATLRAAIDEPLQAAIQSALQKGDRDTTSNEGSVLLKADADALCAQFVIATPQDLMLLALPSAQSIARPPISDFHVGSVGLEAETGNLIFGGNVEFPRSYLGFTLHGEGFVFTRPFRAAPPFPSSPSVRPIPAPIAGNISPSSPRRRIWS